MILGVNNNLAPSVIQNRDASGNYNEVSNPEKLAELYLNCIQTF